MLRDPEFEFLPQSPHPKYLKTFFFIKQMMGYLFPYQTNGGIDFSIPKEIPKNKSVKIFIQGVRSPPKRCNTSMERQKKIFEIFVKLIRL